MNSVDGGTNNDANQQPASLKPTQVQVGALGPPCLWINMMKFEFPLTPCGHGACWSRL